MKRFSIILTPHNYKELSSIIPMFKVIPSQLLFWVLQLLPPFKIGKMTLNYKEEFEGDIILCPLKDEKGMPSPRIFKKILKAMKIAYRKDPDIIGLGNTNSYNNSIYGNLKKIFKMKVITGEYLNAVNALKLINDLNSSRLINSEECKILVIGNLADEFSVFYLELISSYYQEIMLLDADNIKLPRILDRIVYETGTIIKPVKDKKKAIIDADVIIITSNDVIEFEPSWLKSKAIINLLVNNQVLKQKLKSRRDIKIIDGGGIFEIQGIELKGICLNNNKLYPWIAETILCLMDYKLKSSLNSDRLSVRVAQKTYRSALKNKLIKNG